jgi:hypothetical protein
VTVDEFPERGAGDVLADDVGTPAKGAHVDDVGGAEGGHQTGDVRLPGEPPDDTKLRAPMAVTLG